MPYTPPFRSLLLFAKGRRGGVNRQADPRRAARPDADARRLVDQPQRRGDSGAAHSAAPALVHHRSEEHTSELQSLMRTSYAVFCLKNRTPDTYQQLNNLVHATIAPKQP